MGVPAYAVSSEFDVPDVSAVCIQDGTVDNSSLRRNGDEINNSSARGGKPAVDSPVLLYDQMDDLSSSKYSVNLLSE
jgi:hypothetical protein